MLREKLGEGGFGVVWKAENPDLPGKVVAIKFPTFDRNGRSLKVEGLAQHKLQHPLIVKTLSLNLKHEPPYVVLEFIEGQALRDRLRVGGQPSEREFLSIAKDILEACAFAHSQGVIHGDISPANVLIDLDGRAHVSDFGLSKELGQAADSMSLSRSSLDDRAQKIQGTFSYLAPEVRGGEKKSKQSDVFAIGVLLIEMATGDASYLRFPVEGVSAAVSEILEKATARRPQDRYANADQMWNALTAPGAKPGASGTSTTQSTNSVPQQVQHNAPSGEGRLPLGPRHRRWALAAALLLLALPVSCLGVVGRSGQNDPASWAALGEVDERVQGTPGQSSLPPVPRSWEMLVNMADYRRLVEVYSRTTVPDPNTRATEVDKFFLEIERENPARLRELRSNLASAVPDNWLSVSEFLRVKEPMPRAEPNSFEQLRAVLRTTESSPSKVDEPDSR